MFENGGKTVTRLYIVRHCEATGNVAKTFQGRTDCDVTECGQKQLDCLSERFKNIHIDAVYSSPLIRAKKTAKAIVGDRNIPIYTEDKLIEIDGGEIEGVCWVNFKYTHPVIEYTWGQEPHLFHPNGGESMQSVYKRTWEAVLKIVKENDGKTVAIASHGVAIRNIMCHAENKKIEELKSVAWSDNTGVYLLEFDGSEIPKIIINNDTSHLKEGLLPEGSKISQIDMPKPKELG